MNYSGETSTVDDVSIESLFDRLKSIRKQINEESAKEKERKEKYARDYQQNELYGTKKFGRYKFDAPDLDLNLSEEITGNLRTMKVSHSLSPFPSIDWSIA